MDINMESLSNANPRARSRTSPRTKALRESLAIIDTHLLSWKDTNHLDSKSVTEVLTLIRHSVQTLVDQNEGLAPEPTSSKRVAKGKKVEGKHYVAVSHGKAEYVKGTDADIMIENDPEVFFHGPFNTKAGVLYSIEHGTYGQKPRTLSPTV